MKRRIRIIFLLIIVSIVSLIIIQSFWISKFYNINREQTQREIKLSLENSVKKEMSLRYADQAKSIMPDIQGGSIVFVGDTLPKHDFDSIIQLVKAKKTIHPSEVSISVTSLGDSIPNLDSIPEKIEFRLKEIVGTLLSNEKNNQKPVELQTIDSLLQNELVQREIELDYYLEVFDVYTDSVVAQLRPDFYDEKTYGAVRVPATIIGDKEVRLTTKLTAKNFFSPPIVKGSLQAAFMLLLLVVGCYLYMLKTIFDQKKLSTIKNDFINNMTHELKTPIATVSAVVEAMQSFGVLDDKKKTHKYLGVSQKELGRLSGLVEKVLNMAREDREPLQMNPEQLNFREICDNIINSQMIKQEEKEVSFDVKIDEDAEKLSADRFHLVNVMQNLIENSIKYSGDPVRIRIECHRNGEYTKISVSDNGIGIPKKHQAKVFEQFYRIPTGDVHNVKGFGLGLHYVKNIVEKHSGKIGISSESGRGTTFTINLPK